jgi:hypothetical protein
VVRGFTIPVGSAVGGAATSLSLITAGGVLLHPLASETGSVFNVPASEAAQAMNSSNAKVIGAFVTGTNYVGIDLVRLADSGTADSMKFLSDTTQKEFGQTLPLGRTLQYRIYIQAVDFDHALNVLPVAVVVVDANGNVTSITDARRMAFRLGVGGTSPAARTPFTTMATRTEPGVTADATHVIDPFTGGDKALGSLRDWMAAVMTRLWEVGGGGAYWYTPSTRDDLKLVLDPSAVFATTGWNWFWNGTDLLWQGLKYVFAHGETGISLNPVTSQTSASPGLTNLADGDCIYVDLDRTSNASVAAHKAQYASLPSPTIPGTRRIIAWRVSGRVYVDGQSMAVDSGGPHATIGTFGVTKVYAQPVSQPEAIMPVVNGSGQVACLGLSRPGPTVGDIAIGNGAFDTSLTLGNDTVPTLSIGPLLRVGSASIDAKYWLTTRSFPTNPTQTIGDIAWNGSQYCAVFSGTTYVATSPDGLNWTSSTGSIVGAWSGLAWGNNIFLAVGGGACQTSPDGLTWTSRTAVAAQSVAFGTVSPTSSLFVAVGTGGTISTSPDGVTWTARANPGAAWSSITWNGSVFCVIASGSNSTATSPDGITWTAHTLPAIAVYGNICWSGTVFCVLREPDSLASPATSTAYTSPDGITWTVRTLPVAANWNNLGWNGSVFLALSGMGADVNSTVGATSPDGITWTQVVLPTIDTFWFRLASDGRGFVVANSTGKFSTSFFDPGRRSISGKVTLVAGAAVVATPLVKPGQVIQLTCQLTGGVQGKLRIGTVVAGSSFQVLSDSGTDTSTVGWSLEP